MTTRQELDVALRALKPELIARFHVRQLGYFGSFAADLAGPDSDVDILAEFSQTPGWDFFELEEVLETALGRRVDLVTPQALKAQLRDQILAQVRYV